jgi:diguanylate cyclase (GGDEF)-like protein
VLKEILKRDRSNAEALQRLADIYTRVDERRNLAATLNTLVEVASRRGLKDVATDALQRLMDIEPELAARQQQAQAVRDAAPASRASAEAFPEGFESAPALMEWTRESVTPDGPAARPGPRAERPAASSATPEMLELTRGLGDEPVFELKSGGEEYDVPAGASPAAPQGDYSEYSMELADDIVAQHPEFISAKVRLLEELVAGQPKYIDGRIKLKKIYLSADMREKAAAQCLEIAKLYEEQGETEKAKACIAEAYDLRPSVESLTAQAAPVEETVALDEMFTLQEFNKYFDREWRRAIRDAKPLSLVKLEVDAFNDYVDTYGLLSGDYCLERLAGALEGDLMRPGDFISSVGGGLFLVLLPDTPDSAVGIVADRLRRKVEAMNIRHESSPVGEWVTASAGAATAIPHPKYSSDALIAAADDALVQAKVAGGNRVVTSPLITN